MQVHIVFQVSTHLLLMQIIPRQLRVVLKVLIVLQVQIQLQVYRVQKVTIDQVIQLNQFLPMSVILQVVKETCSKNLVHRVLSQM